MLARAGFWLIPTLFDKHIPSISSSDCRIVYQTRYLSWLASRLKHCKCVSMATKYSIEKRSKEWETLELTLSTIVSPFPSSPCPLFSLSQAAVAWTSCRSRGSMIAWSNRRIHTTVCMMIFRFIHLCFQSINSIALYSSSSAQMHTLIYIRNMQVCRLWEMLWHHLALREGTQTKIMQRVQTRPSRNQQYEESSAPALVASQPNDVNL